MQCVQECVAWRVGISSSFPHLHTYTASTPRPFLLPLNVQLLALEYGIAVSGIDFTDTRWASLIKAILYIANKQSPADLQKARDRLQELADAGDATAKDALEEEDVSLVIFNVLYAFIESISEVRASVVAVLSASQ